MTDPTRPAWGFGLATIHQASGRVLDTWYPRPGARRAPP